jgi:hypothetical protein
MRCMAGSESGGEHEGTGLYADVKPEIGQQITPGLDGTPLMCAWASGVCVVKGHSHGHSTDRQLGRGIARRLYDERIQVDERCTMSCFFDFPNPIH